MKMSDDLVVQVDRQREECDSLRSRLLYHQETSVSRQIVARLEARIAELQSSSDAENASNVRIQVVTLGNSASMNNILHSYLLFLQEVSFNLFTFYAYEFSRREHQT